MKTVEREKEKETPQERFIEMTLRMERVNERVSSLDGPQRNIPTDRQSDHIMREIEKT